jgi:alkylhydroperoxidase domain protein
MSSAVESAERVTTYETDRRPQAFTRRPLGWRPWLTPLREDDLEQRHWDGLVEPSRASFGYFALLARDPEVLGARTRADLDIFTNDDGGLPRAERELVAAAVSRRNGCIFCASVHARLAVQFDAGLTELVDDLLANGVGTTGWQDERREAVVAAAVALAETPVAFDAGHVARLRAAGLDDAAVADLVSAAAFFSWANRLMLSLGEPDVPARARA